TANNPAAVKTAGFPIRTQGNPGVFSCTGIQERQTLLGTPNGPFRLTVGANTTGPIAANASNATIQAALEGLASVGVGKVTVAGSLPAGLGLTFAASLGDVPQVTVQAAALTGLTITPNTDGAAASAGTSEVVTVDGTPTPPYTLVFGGNETAAINDAT